MTNIKGFGEYIKNVRKASGKKIIEVAREAEISHSYISQVENGKLSNMPSLDIIYRLSTSLGIDFYSLMNLAGYENSSTDSLKLKNATKDLSLLKVDEEYHFNGYYPTLAERDLIHFYMRFLFEGEGKREITFRFRTENEDE